MAYLIHIAVMACLYIILTSSFNLLIGYAGVFNSRRVLQRSPMESLRRS